MSKKNKKSTKRNAHQFALQREKQDLAKAKVKKEKAAAKNSKAASAAGGVRKKAKKGIRIRKHVVVRGVKIKDSESKKKVKEILAAEAAMREMQVDAEEAGGAEEPGGGDGMDE